MNQTWTYHVRPERDDMELEGSYKYCLHSLYTIICAQHMHTEVLNRYGFLCYFEDNTT